MPGPALLARLDRAIAELLELRDAVAELRADVAGAAFAPMGANPENVLEDDFSPANLVEISTAVKRFNRPADSLRYLCRKEDCGKKIGGRWLASVPRIQRRLNGG